MQPAATRSGLDAEERTSDLSGFLNRKCAGRVERGRVVLGTSEGKSPAWYRCSAVARICRVAKPLTPAQLQQVIDIRSFPQLRGRAAMDPRGHGFVHGPLLTEGSRTLLPPLPRKSGLEGNDDRRPGTPGDGVSETGLRAQCFIDC